MDNDQEDKCVQACYTATLCSQSYQSFLNVSVVGWWLRQSQKEKDGNRREQSQKEMEPAGIQAGSGRHTWGNGEKRYICRHSLLDWSQTYKGYTVSGSLIIDKNMLV